MTAASAAAQQLSDLEPERPLRIEDAHPLSYRAFSASADWTYNIRRGGMNDHGPGFSLLYGALRGLEVGAEVRYVTRPGRNAQQGVSSGDIILHALYGVMTETEHRPAIALRVGVEFPTGLDSKGTDLHVAGLATRSFDGFRLHVNAAYTRLGAIFGLERRERWEAIGGIDFVAGRRTDTLLLADVSVRSNPVRDANAIVTPEIGVRRRLGVQTILFAATGTDVEGGPQRARLRVRAGLSHIY